MRTLILAAAAALAGAGTAWAERPGGLGIGAAVGTVTGLTAKYWLSETQAVDGGVGYSSDVAFYADYLWHGWKALPQPRKGKLAARVGIGFRVEDKADTEFGLRTVAGADYRFEGRPVEAYLDLAPVIRLSPGASLGFDAALGVRYYFSAWN